MTKTFESIPMYQKTAKELWRRLVKLDYQCYMLHYLGNSWKLHITVPSHKARAVENAVSRFALTEEERKQDEKEFAALLSVDI